MLRTSNLRSIYSSLKQIHRTSSIVTPAISSEKHGTPEDNTSTSQEVPVSNKIEGKHKSPMVAAVFESLKQPSKRLNSPSLDEIIINSKTPEELLSLSQKSTLNRKQALKLLGRSSSGNSINPPSYLSKKTIQEKDGNLSLVLGVTADDEAAKLVSTLSLSQKIKTLTTLATQKKRPLPILRSLAYNIASSMDKVTIKEGADILFALAALNFPDEVVLEKVCADLIEAVPLCERSAVIGSISTSLGRLRYRHDRLLDHLNKWVLTNQIQCRKQECVSILITHAIVNHNPVMGDKFFDMLGQILTEDDLPSATAWLDVVWALEVFGKTNNEHYKSVLSQRFIQRILSTNSDNASVAWKKKLLNINGAAKLSKDYKGPTLEDNKDVSVIPMVRTKEKQALVNSVLDGLSNVLPSPAYLRNNIDTGMGFLIDAECRLDGKLTPFPLVDKKTGQPIAHKPGKGLKIAIMCWDYHDNTRGRVDLTGVNALTKVLLSKAGYRVLCIQYNEYNIKDKLSDRVQFLQEKLKRTVRPSG